MEIHQKFTGEGLLRWVLLALAALAAALLGATLETGRAYGQNSVFSFKGYLNRFVTPNDDGLNDLAILCVDNPKDFAVRGRILDLRGHFVAEMTHTRTGTDALVLRCRSTFGGQFLGQGVTWDGKAGGSPVSSGVYVWRLEAEETTVTGTVVVAR